MRVGGRVGWKRCVAPAALALMAVSGCATSGTVRKLEDDTRLTHALVLDLAQKTEQLRRDLGELRVHLQSVRDELAGMVREEDARQREALEAIRKRLVSAETRVEALAGAIRGIEMSVGGLTDQVVRLEGLPATGPRGRRDGRGAKPGVRTAAAPVPAEELFGRALESFKNGDLGQAILDFEDFLSRHPSHPLVGTAQFWIGEAYFTSRDYQHATAEYRKAVDIAPKGEKTPEALLKLGLAYRALKRQDRAREAWAQLLREFPQSDAAQRARIAVREVAPAKPATPGPR